MEYNKVVAVTGLPGLYELVSSKADGGVVRNLDDKTSKFVSNRMHNFSHLESIEIYTTSDNVNLVDVFHAMQNSKEEIPAANADAKAIKAYFEKVYPDMDFERVYGSDMKKMIKWLDILTKAGIEIKQTEYNAEGEDAVAEEKPKAAAKPTTATKKESIKAGPTVKKISTPRKMS